MTKWNPSKVAMICHEANRAYCLSIGDDSQPSWYDAPDWQKESALKGVQFHFHNHAHGITPTPSASHDCWLEEKRLAGWKYGPVKDPDKKEHPCFVSYDDLPIEQRMKDYLFGAICAAFANAQ
jgi:hypothetical protein